PQVSYPEECGYCNGCVEECPTGAIRLRIPLPMMRQPGPPPPIPRGRPRAPRPWAAPRR
ncbi:MAG: hypothetical protein C4567_13375, partial [Deltaproteobacteria bacterium]